MEFTPEQLQQLSDLFDSMHVANSDPNQAPAVIEGGRVRWEGVLTILGTYAGKMDPRLLKTVTWPELPLTLYSQTSNEGGHSGADIVGNIDKIWVDGNTVYGSGLFDTTEEALKTVELVDGGSLKGISVDLRDGEINFIENEAGPPDQIWKEAVIGGATLVGLPAFENARIDIKRESLDGLGDELARAVASVGPHIYLAKFFTRKKFSGPTKLNITPEGEIYGHAVVWGKTHRGADQRTWKAKPTGDKHLHDFNIGTTHLDDGTSIDTGVFTSDGLHAPLHHYSWAGKTISRFAQGFRDQVMGQHHMENVAMQLAQVVAWEDEYGMAVHGSLKPEVTQAQATNALAGCTSIDTRYGKVAGVHFVNVCGFVPPAIVEKDSEGNIARRVASMGSALEDEGCADCEKTSSPDGATVPEAGASQIVDLNAVKELDAAFAKTEMDSILAKLKHSS